MFFPYSTFESNTKILSPTYTVTRLLSYYKMWIYRVAVLANTKFTTWHYFDFFFQIHLVYQEVDKIDFAAKSVIFLSVLVMIAGLFIYPLGFNSKFIRKHCGGGSSMYNSEQCEVGWGLVLAVVGTALAMFCPVLSHYTDMQTTDLLWCQASLLYSTSLYLPPHYVMYVCLLVRLH